MQKEFDAVVKVGRVMANKLNELNAHIKYLDAHIEGLTHELGLQQAQNKRYREALQEIAGWEGSTGDIGMGFVRIAQAALKDKE